MAIVSVGTSSTTLLAAGDFQQITLSHRGLNANTIWYQYGGTAVVGTGIPLDENDKIVIATTSKISGLDLVAIAETGATDVSSYGI